MAAACARRTLQFSRASGTTIFASKASKFATRPAFTSPISLHKLTSSRFSSRLAGALSLMPLHNATSSALFTSLLSLHNRSWGCLSEGFATPL